MHDTTVIVHSTRFLRQPIVAMTMKVNCRFCFCLVIFCGVISFGYETATWMMTPLLSSSSLSTTPLRMDEIQRQRQELNDRYARIRRETEVRHQVIDDLLAGRKTLLEAASRFQAINQNSLEFKWDAFRYSFAGRSDEERTCRQVIAHVAARLRAQANQGDYIIEQLNGELRNHQAHNNTIRLPAILE